MSKLIVIVGITGNQGSSVAEVFLKDANYKIRGLTRDPNSSASKALAAKGIEIVQGDLDDISSLQTAFKGATHIFGNTLFQTHLMIDPSCFDHSLLKPGQAIQDWCFETEVRQGRNIADAAASTLDTLEMYIWSTLSHATKWSGGKYKTVLHFDSKAAVVEYIREKYWDSLAGKLSLLNMGLFVTNWRWGSAAVPWSKREDGTMVLRIPGEGNKAAPFVVPTEAGYFVKALTQFRPGKHILAFSNLLTWSEYVALWTRVTGVPAIYEESTVEEMDKATPGGFGQEIGEMYAYAKEFGYDGGDPEVVTAEDLGVKMPATSVEDFFRSEDWSPLFQRFA